MLIHQTLRLRHSFQKDWPKNDNRAISLSQTDPNDECNGGLTVPWHPKRGRTEWKHWHKASKQNYVFQKTITRYYKTKSRQFRSTKHAGLNASLQRVSSTYPALACRYLTREKSGLLTAWRIASNWNPSHHPFNIFQNPALHVGITCLACSGSVWFQLRCMRWWFGMVGLGSTYYMGNCRICRKTNCI